MCDRPLTISTDSASCSESHKIPGAVVVRRFMTGDPVEDITELLHKAYGPQIMRGLTPLAGRQDSKTTLSRVLNSECYLAFEEHATDGTRWAASQAKPNQADVRVDVRVDDRVDCSEDARGCARLVGVILLNEFEHVTMPEYFVQSGVAYFAMFGVLPQTQGRGIGKRLLAQCETRSRELGYEQLALSMAEPDTKLKRYYETRGYRFVEHWQWPYTNYRSCILSKPL